jgi:hypothetical protein
MASLLTPSERLKQELFWKSMIGGMANKEKTHSGCGYCVEFEYCKKREIKNVKVNTSYCQWPTNRFKSKEEKDNLKFSEK